jgi:hypothetical protein
MRRMNISALGEGAEFSVFGEQELIFEWAQ